MSRILLAGTLTLVASLSPHLLAQWPRLAPPNVPRTADGKVNLDAPTPKTPDGKPDLSGYYSSNAGGANYGLEKHGRDFLTPGTRGVVIDPADGSLPYQPWARAERINRELPYRGYDDPTAHCFPAGVPRSMYVPAAFHIIQTPDYIVFLHERMTWRMAFALRHSLSSHCLGNSTNAPGAGQYPAQ